MRYFTYQDAVDHCLDYLGGNPQDRAQWDARRAVQQAYRELTNARTWSYLYQEGRIHTSAPYSTGTVAYDDTGGTYERMVTLAGGTWPSWAGSGAQLRVSYVTYRVDERKSDTVITLDANIDAAADIAAGASYTLFRDTYPLPEDFVQADTLIYEMNFGGLTFVRPTEWLWFQRVTQGAGFPRWYTLQGDPQFPDRLVCKFFPYPDRAATVDYIYHRRPRALFTQGYSTGVIGTTAASTAVTSSGGAGFAAAMAGSILRVGTPTTVPTGYERDDPPALEGRIAEVTSATTLRLVDAADTTHATCKYIISDPIDIEYGVMLNPFLRCAEKNLSIARSLDGKTDAFAAYDLALREAKAADSRSFQGRVAGMSSYRRIPYKYMPAVFY